jgi:CheY-like chemotaxis protein
VLVNLLLNACHAIDELPGPGHVIRLSAAPWSDGVMISVEDTGPGIPAVLKDRVLEPFFTTKGRELGTGLGLSIANEVASQHGGALHIGQSPLGGAMVGLFLPTHRLADTVTEEEPLEPAELTRSLRILLIDDEPAILRALSRSLAPHAVETASSGFEALEKLERSPDFDLILCDLSMPRMNGAQVFSHAVTWDERLRERFVIVTGGAVTPELRRFIEEETVPVLQKPFSRTALQSVLRMVSV